jgi:penicillin-binding protein 1C
VSVGRRASVGVFLMSGALSALGLWNARPLPADALPPFAGTVVLDRNGAVIAERPGPDGLRAGARTAADPGPEGRVADVRAAYGSDLVEATIAAEDHRFALHPGVDPIAILRAFRANARAGRTVEGGSTLAQQLARTVWVRPPGLHGKLVEAAWALRLTASLGQDGVLRAYLSRTFYGSGAVGAEAASLGYFGRPPAALSLAQAATLAAIPRRPADLDPRRFPRKARQARDAVLDRMRRAGLAAHERVAEAHAEPLQLVDDPPVGEAPHFVRRLLAERTEPIVRTTLDLRLQRQAEAIVREELTGLAGRGVGQAAVIVVENRTRDVLAYIGSARWDADDGQVDGVRAERSPGSALKPFLYARALELGGTLADVVADTPGTWSTTHGNWHPENYSGSTGGPVRLRPALAQSLNLPAVRLAQRIGVSDLHRLLGRLGISTLRERPDHYGLALALGSGEVRLDELTGAYAALASSGRWRPLRMRMAAPVPSAVPVLRPSAAFLVLDALDDPDARAPAFGRDAVLETPFPLAAKTGTSTGWRDNWAFGVAPHVTVGVWVGNFDGSPMGEVSGVTGAGPILARVASAAEEGRARGAFEPPAGVVRGRVCALSGAGVGTWCRGTVEEWLPAGGARPPCDWHTADGTRLPVEHAAWAAENGLAVRRDAGLERPSAAAAAPAVRIAYPTPNTAFWLDHERPASDQAIPLRADASGVHAVWTVDGAVIAEVDPPFSSRWEPTPGDHVVHLRVDGVTSAPVRVWVGARP